MDNAQKQTFTKYLTRRGIDSFSVQKYVLMMQRILSSITLFNATELDEYILTLVDRKCKRSYINKHRTAIRYWSKCFDLPYKEYKLPEFKVKSQIYRRARFTDEEIMQFLNLPCPDGFPKDRWKMWTRFFTYVSFTGCRGSEIARLQVSNIDWGRNVIDINEGKLGAERSVPISPLYTDALKQHIQELSQPYLFPAIKKTGCPHIQLSGWIAHFKKRIEILGNIKRQNLTTHSFRHSFAYRQADEGIPLETLMDLLGHKKAETTKIYLQQNERKMRQAIMDDRMLKRFDSPDIVIQDFYQLNTDAAKKHQDRVKVSFDWAKDGELLIRIGINPLWQKPKII